MNKITAFDVVAWSCTKLFDVGGDSLPLCQAFLLSLFMAPAEQPLTACGNHASGGVALPRSVLPPLPCLHAYFLRMGIFRLNLER